MDYSLFPNILLENLLMKEYYFEKLFHLDSKNMVVHKKFCLYEIGRKHFKDWSDISWRFPTEGMGIPAKEKYSV